MANDLHSDNQAFSEESNFADYELSLAGEDNQAAAPDDAEFGSEQEHMSEVSQAHEPTAYSSAGQSGDDNALDHIKISLDFELGNAPITLAELKRLGPGHSFDLALDMKAPVAIMVQGKCLGRCELVEIDQRLGARIVEWQGCGVGK